MRVIEAISSSFHVMESIAAWERHSASGVFDPDFFHKMRGFMLTLKIDEPGMLAEMMAVGQLAESKGDGKRIIKSGCVTINGQKVSDPFHVVSPGDVMFDHWILIGKGKSKRTLFLVEKPCAAL